MLRTEFEDEFNPPEAEEMGKSKGLSLLLAFEKREMRNDKADNKADDRIWIVPWDLPSCLQVVRSKQGNLKSLSLPDWETIFKFGRR